MLSTEKAKFKSVRDKTNSQTNKDRQQKIKPIQTLGIKISFRINLNIVFKLMILTSIESIDVFKNSWFMVSKTLVRTIREKIRIRFELIF